MVVKKTKKHLGGGKRTKKVCQKGGLKNNKMPGMPIINYLLYIGVDGIDGFAYAMGLTIIFAMLSWFLIEKPSLKLKINALRNV